MTPTPYAAQPSPVPPVDLAVARAARSGATSTPVEATTSRTADTDPGSLRVAPVERTVERVTELSAAPATVRPAPPLAATGLSILAALLLGFALHVGGVSHVLQARNQSLAFAELREQLARGTVPVGQTADGALLTPGTPLALLQLPGEDVPKVVLEGTAATVLDGGPGHRRDSVLPGQPGTSVLYGRRASYGGPFAAVPDLVPGKVLSVTTGQGTHDYRVTGVRRAGDPAPPPLAAGAGRLTLVTASGPSYLPSGAVRVDAELLTPVQQAPGRVLGAGSLAPAEKPLAGDRSVLVALLLWGQALLLAACALAWARVRWGLRQAWVVGVPVLGALGLAVAHSAAGLLPNLL